MEILLIFYFTGVSVVLTFAIVSNVLVIICVAKYRHLRSVTNVLISNLAACDVVLSGVFLPQKLHDVSHPENYHEGEVMCKLINFFPIFLTTCSCYTLVFISIERRRALVQSMRPQISVPQALKALPFIWLGSVVVGIPTLIEFSVVPLTTDSSDINSGNYLYVSQLNNNSVERHLHCGTNNFPRTLGMANCFLVTLFAFVIPLTLISINYVQLVVFVNKRCRTVEPQLPSRSDVGAPRVEIFVLQPTNTHLYKHREHLVKMFIVMVVAFATCWSPFYIIYIYTKVSGKDESQYSNSTTNLLLIVLSAASSAANAVIYVIFNCGLREACRTICCTFAAKWRKKINGRNVKITV